MRSMLGVYALLCAGCAPSGDGDLGPTAVVRRGGVRVEVRTVGELRAARSYSIASEIRSNRAKVVEVVPEGTPVRAGDVILRFDPTPFQEDVEKYRVERDRAAAALQAVELELKLVLEQNKEAQRNAEHALMLSRLDLENVSKGQGPVTLKKREVAEAQGLDALGAARRELEDMKTLFGRGFVTRAELAQAEAAVRQAERNYELARLEHTTEREYTRPADVQRAEAAVADAEKTLAQVEQQAESMQKRQRALIEKAQTELEDASRRLALAENELDRTVVRSPATGYVVYIETYIEGEKRTVRIGDSLWSGNPVIQIPDLSEMFVNAQVRETDLHKVRMQLPAEVSIEAYPKLELRGEVSFIGTLGSHDDRDETTRYFRVHIELDRVDPRLRPGMTASVTIVGDHVTDAVLVPLDAVFSEDGQSVAYRVERAGVRTVPIELGLHDDRFAVVHDGLTEGDRVLLFEPDDVQQMRPW